EMCLGPTHEEVITDLAKNYVQSYRQLPLTLYQIQTKFRDELRTRFGIVRACEFIMKDAYSFDRDFAGLQQVYQKMYGAYQNVFQRCGVDVHIIAADSGAMGGDVSHEFLALAPIGEDEVALCGGCGFAGAGSILTESGRGTCPSCGKPLTKQVAIELGHIFQLGTKYSQAQGAMFLDEDGKLKPMIMGCYGIGVSRLIAAVVEKNYDEQGIVWPREVSPYDVEILPLTGEDEEVLALAREYADMLEQDRFDVLVDDRAESPGRKFHDADLIGIPYRLILGARGLKEGVVELKERKSGRVQKIRKEDVRQRLPGILHNGFSEKD
ncbi:MAG TPA: His/Gly/Thr/Pro-type tRNA ligase C-terminal domain-containing protein, partial [Candidatus Omnitrophota bacterium]|nr:His/Gly/Thr/Pro-type tRNA ligase C-terminal domain-containing protein [Candidatus Omnitrophota bacterium]